MALAGLSLLLLLWPRTLGAEEISALTEPSSDVEMSFSVAGRVKHIPIKVGQTVESGQALIELNTEALEARLSQLTLEAANNAEVLAAEAELKQKQQDLVKLEQAFNKGAATRIELEHARLEVEIAQYRLQSAQHSQAVARLKQQETEAEIREYTLLSPISGLVEHLDVEVGETAKTSENAVRVVALNPLWVETDAPLSSFENFAPGREVPVIFPDGQSRSGRVVFRGAVADSASDTVRVRLELENPENHHAGERVMLSLP